MDDNAFRQLLDRLGLSWQGYARVRKGVKKRVNRHMQAIGCHSMDEYLRALNNHEILTEVERLMSVSISHFFRDRYLWQVLDEEILPEVIQRRNERRDVWSAGCSLGQEVYSFAILWDMTKDKFHHSPRIYLFATDNNPDYLKKARAGVYHKSSLKGLPDKTRDKYFRRSDDGLHYIVDDHVRENIIWEIHDLTKQPPPLVKKFHIIFLRNNLLTYYRKENRGAAFTQIVERLHENGFLIIGSHERAPSEAHTLVRFKECPYILQKIQAS